MLSVIRKEKEGSSASKHWSVWVDNAIEGVTRNEEAHPVRQVSLSIKKGILILTSCNVCCSS